MKHLLICCLLSLVACQTRVYDNGKPALLIGSNLKGKMSYVTKTLDYSFDGTLNNSTPTRSAGSVLGIVGSDVVAGIWPGTGVVPVIGKAATVTSPHLFQPKGE